MKVLALVAEPRLPNIDAIYRYMKIYCDVEVIKVDKKSQKKLKNFCKNISFTNYDRVIIDLHFKRIVNQTRFLRTIPNLLIYEEDACQNYINRSKWFGKFLRFYKKLGNFTLICTSAGLANRFRSAGIDARFLRKGFDDSYLKNLHQSRDIEIGFVGRVGNEVYSDRRQLLTFLEQERGLKVLRADPGENYLLLLNRIRIFISADIGLMEYMAKTFEAMACGCLVVAYRQGFEEGVLELVDMENIVLYSDRPELLKKLDNLQASPQLVEEIAMRGQMLSESHHGFRQLATSMYELCCLSGARPVCAPAKSD